MESEKMMSSNSKLQLLNTANCLYFANKIILVTTLFNVVFCKSVFSLCVCFVNLL